MIQPQPVGGVVKLPVSIQWRPKAGSKTNTVLTNCLIAALNDVRADIVILRTLDTPISVDSVKGIIMTSLDSNYPKVTFREAPSPDDVRWDWEDQSFHVFVEKQGDSVSIHVPTLPLGRMAFRATQVCDKPFGHKRHLDPQTVVDAMRNLELPVILAPPLSCTEIRVCRAEPSEFQELVHKASMSKLCESHVCEFKYGSESCDLRIMRATDMVETLGGLLKQALPAVLNNVPDCEVLLGVVDDGTPCGFISDLFTRRLDDLKSYKQQLTSSLNDIYPYLRPWNVSVDFMPCECKFDETTFVAQVTAADAFAVIRAAKGNAELRVCSSEEESDDSPSAEEFIQLLQQVVEQNDAATAALCIRVGATLREKLSGFTWQRFDEAKHSRLVTRHIVRVRFTGLCPGVYANLEKSPAAYLVSMASSEYRKADLLTIWLRLCNKHRLRDWSQQSNELCVLVVSSDHTQSILGLPDAIVIRSNEHIASASNQTSDPMYSITLVVETTDEAVEMALKYLESQTWSEPIQHRVILCVTTELFHNTDLQNAIWSFSQRLLRPNWVLADVWLANQHFLRGIELPSPSSQGTDATTVILPNGIIHVNSVMPRRPFLSLEQQEAMMKAWLTSGQDPTWGLIASLDMASGMPVVPRLRIASSIVSEIVKNCARLLQVHVDAPFPGCGLTTTLRCVAVDSVAYMHVYYVNSAIPPDSWDRIVQTMQQHALASAGFQRVLIIFDNHCPSHDARAAVKKLRDSHCHFAIVHSSKAPLVKAELTRKTLHWSLDAVTFGSLCDAFANIFKQSGNALQCIKERAQSTCDLYDRHIWLVGLAAIKGLYEAPRKSIRAYLEKYHNDPSVLNMLCGLAVVCASVKRAKINADFMTAKTLLHGHDQASQVLSDLVGCGLLTVYGARGTVPSYYFGHCVLARLYLQIAHNYSWTTPLCEQFRSLWTPFTEFWHASLIPANFLELIKVVLTERHPAMSFSPILYSILHRSEVEECLIAEQCLGEISSKHMCKDHYHVLLSRSYRQLARTCKRAQNSASHSKYLNLAQQHADAATCAVESQSVSVMHNQASITLHHGRELLHVGRQESRCLEALALFEDLITRYGVVITDEMNIRRVLDAPVLRLDQHRDALNKLNCTDLLLRLDSYLASRQSRLASLDQADDAETLDSDDDTASVDLWTAGVES